MDIIVIVFALIILSVFIFDKIKSSKKHLDDDNNEIKINTDKLPYRKKYLLSKNELWFYKALKPIAEKYNYTILAKIRLADLIEVNNEINKNEYLKYFSKIKSKHIDFALCSSDNLYPLLLIELNDNSHKSENRTGRDNFLNQVLTNTGYKILFTYGTQNLEEQISNILKSIQKNNHRY